MGSAKGVAAVQHIALIGDVRPGEAQCEALAEALAQREINCVIWRKVPRTVAIEKSRAVVELQCGKHPPGEMSLDPGRQCIPLVMVEVVAAIRRRREVREPTGDTAESLGVLVG